MLMKVFNKGQVVIPAEIRRELDIHVGDRLEVDVDRDHLSVELHKPVQRDSQALAGALAKYATHKRFPTRRAMRKALKEGLRNE